MVQLRRATDADYEYARQVQRTAYRDMVIRQYGKWEDPLQDGFFDRSWRHAPYDIILSEAEPCGYCRIDEHSDTLQLVEFAIEVSKQGHGRGTQLLTLFKDMAGRKGKNAQLNVMHTNVRAKALYERNGFSVYGESPTHYLMRHEPALLRDNR
jgi:ribosomal protein S18 acetylase RimI-like enzyme